MDIFSPGDPNFPSEFKRVWVDSIRAIPPHEKKADISVPVFADLTGDGCKEVIFSVFGAMRTYFPRRLYAFDLVKHQWIKSKPFGAMIESLQLFDHEGDGHWEIAGSCGSPDNNQPGYDYPLSDSSAWLMVFNDHLELLDSLPYQFIGKMASCFPFPVQKENKTELHGVWQHLGNYDSPEFFFITQDLSRVRILDTIPVYDGHLGVSIFPIEINGVQNFLGVRGTHRLMFVNHGLSLRHEQPVKGG